MKGAYVAGVSAVLAALGVLGCQAVNGDGSVWEPPSRLWPKKFLGRDYWTILTKSAYTSLERKKDPKPPFNPEIQALPAFQDTGIYYSFGRNPPKGGKATWRTMRENYCSLDKRDDKSWEWFRPKNDGRPAICVVQHHRRCNSLSGEIDLDYADYAAFTNGLPNLVGFSMLSEWANDARSIPSRCKSMEKYDPERAAQVLREWGEETKGRFSSAEFLRRFWDRRLATYYNDFAHCMPLSSCARIDHMQCVWGAHALTIETSGTTGKFMEYRWDASTIVTRGAARQFDVPWNWYIAQYSCGYTHDTRKWVTDSHSSGTAQGLKEEEAGRPWNGPAGEGHLHASKFPQFVDYLVADAPQRRECYYGNDARRSAGYRTGKSK